MDNASVYSQAHTPLTYGAELKDQIPVINQHLVNGISFLNEFRDFCKERANIERDYAHRIEGLVRKYQLKKEKKSNATPTTGVPPSPLEPDYDPALSDGSTTSRAWTSILNDTEALSRDRHLFSEALISKVYDPLKVLATKKDDARKKHIQFAQKLLSERDKSAQERDKAKARYDASCDEVESSKQKQERAYDERNQERLRRTYYQDILDMNNNKNSYVLALQVLNTHRKKYYEQDLPELSNNMQVLDESRIEGLRTIWENYIGLETKLTADAQAHLDSMLHAVRAVEPSIDSSVFVRSQRRPWNMPADQPFESSSTFNDTDELVVDDNAQVFLSNKLMKLRRKQAQATVDINNKFKDMEGLQNLKEAYTGSNSLGDPEDVQENILETSRAITLLQTMNVLYEAEINTIVKTIGDSGSSGSLNQVQAHVIYDYDASGPAELTVRAGDMVVVVEQDDGSGWVACQLNGSAPGLIPASYIEIEQFYEAPNETAPAQYVRALYDYDAQSELELTIRQGDLIVLTSTDCSEGWWEGTLNGVTAQFPASYVETV
ncbi:hypothetical protein BGZ94_003713 [Podila epigama]|nr:hypothetical protein BGZ94_003713 [Podila epigama]